MDRNTGGGLMFKEEHGAGDWGTDKLTTKYLKDTPGQEDAIVKSKKVVLKKKAVEEEKPQPDNKGYAERQAAAKKAKQDKMDRMVRARLAGDRAGKPRKNRGAFWRQEKSVGEEVEVAEAKQGSYRQSPEDQKQREKNIQKGIDRMVQLGKDVKAGRKPKMSPARAKLRGEDVEVVESDKAEYNKLMDKYGDMPMSKVPMKARLRIRELGRSVRGDKGGPTAGDLVKNMKRRRMGEEVEQIDESLGNFMADYDGKEMKVRAKDEEDARSRVARRLKIPKSKQQKIVVWEPMTDTERRDFELDDDGEREYANRYGHDMARKADRLKQRAKKRAGRRKQRNEGVEQVDEKTDKVRDFVKQDKSGYHRKHQQKLDKIMKRGGSKIGDMIDKATIKRAETKKPQSKVSQFILGKKEGSPFWDKVKQTDSDEAKDRRDARRGVSRNRQAERQLRSKKQRNEEVEVAEGGMIGRTKPSRELNVQKDEKPHLAGVKSLKYQKRAAHKAERKKGKQDVKINPELDETVERAKRGVDMAKQRVLAAKQRVARAKARDLGQKRRDMRNEDSEIEEGGMSGRDFAQAGRSADYKSRVTGTQQRYAANRAKRSARATEKHSDVMRRRAIARARSRMRK